MDSISERTVSARSVSIEGYETMLEREKECVRQRIASGQNEKQLQLEYRDVFRTLDEWLVDVKSAGDWWKEKTTESVGDRWQEETGKSMSGGVQSENGMWELLKGAFGKKRENLEDEIQKTGDVLEYAFDFMELCFGESQEMVVFITELSCNPHAMWFLGEYECPRYYRYNKALLFEDREDQIRRKLDDIRGLMNGEGQ